MPWPARSGQWLGTFYPVTAVATGVLGLVAGALVPRLIASVPEPEPEDPEEPEQHEAAEADETAADETEPEEPKVPYAAVAAAPGLAWKAAVASALSGGGSAGRSAGRGQCCTSFPWSRSGWRWPWSTGGPATCPPG